MLNIFKRKNTKNTITFRCCNRNCYSTEAMIAKHPFVLCIRCSTLQCLNCKKPHSGYADCEGNIIGQKPQIQSWPNLEGKIACTCGLENCQRCQQQLQYIQNQQENTRKDTLSDKFFKVLAKIFLPVVQ